MQSLMTLGRGMMGGAFPEDCILIGDRLAQLQASFETLQRHSFGRTRTLKDGLKAVSFCTTSKNDTGILLRNYWDTI